MVNTLIIVESPTKARKIQTYFNDGTIVKSSFGHIQESGACPGPVHEHQKLQVRAKPPEKHALSFSIMFNLNQN